MRALVQKLSAVQEAALITTIFAGWFILSAMAYVLAGFPQGDAAAYDDGAAISLVVFECVVFAVAALVLRWRGWQGRDFLFSVSWRDAVAAILLLIAAEFANFLIWEAVSSRFDDGSILRNLAQPGAVSFGAALLMSVVNGTFEEFFLCR